MATQVGKWEVVGKGNKRRANHDKKKEKPKINDSPKIDVASPVPQAETIYKAFEKHEKKLNKDNNLFNPYENKAEERHESDKGQDVKKPIKKKPVAAKPQKSDREQLAEAIKKLDIVLMKDILAKDEAAFPNNPSLWLKDLASYLHLQLQNVSQKDLVFEDMPSDYPFCLLKDDMKSFIIKILKNVPSTTLDLFFQYCMNEMVQELSRGHSAYGMQLMIQCTVKVCPNITVTRLEEYEEMLNGRKSRPREALAIMWALGQLPGNDLAQGLKVWTTIMMPMIYSKQLAKFSVNYLEKLMQNASTELKEGLMTSKDFFNVLALTLGSRSPLVSNHNLKRKMLSLYPKLKAISFSSQPKSSGRVYFPSLLRYLKCSNEISMEYLTEVLDCLTFCLENDPECFIIWVELYPTALVESSVLIYHVVDTWTTRSARVPKEKFRKAIKTFQVFHSEHEKGKQLPGFEDCVHACETAEQKFKQKSSCCSIKGFLKLILVIVLGVIAFDLYKHKGYEGSKTAYFAKQYKIEDGALRVYGNVKNGFNKGNSWVQKNYPAYYSQFREYMDPAAEYAKDKLVIAGNYVAEQTKPARKYLNKKIPEILEKFEEEVPKYWAKIRGFFIHYWNIYWPIVHHYLVILQDLFLKYVPPFVNKVCEMASSLGNRIYDLAPDFFSSVAVSLDNLWQSIAEKIPKVVAVVKEYAVIAMNMMINLANHAITWIQNLANSPEAEEVVTKQATSKSVPK
ncbi:transmembrane protein 214-A-like [Actinia tenebrosa]|uniref:Transmembrane protein 214-A-like n=1 Tax=Actinia tenebrosa TaxID=6105 RepID=A0A6P8IUR7_ACTTE|nr:transmembrane protein 214-A-like [Actinia tenebrosa]